MLKSLCLAARAVAGHEIDGVLAIGVTWRLHGCCQLRGRRLEVPANPRRMSVQLIARTFQLRITNPKTAGQAGLRPSSIRCRCSIASRPDDFLPYPSSRSRGLSSEPIARSAFRSRSNPPIFDARINGSTDVYKNFLDQLLDYLAREHETHPQCGEHRQRARTFFVRVAPDRRRRAKPLGRCRLARA